MNPIYNHTKSELFSLVDYYEGLLYNDDGSAKENSNHWLFNQELNILYQELFADKA